MTVSLSPKTVIIDLLVTYKYMESIGKHMLTFILFSFFPLYIDVKIWKIYLNN